MAFSEYWLGQITDISKDFYQKKALGVLEELASRPRQPIHVATARRAAELYAEARRCEASAQADLATNRNDKSFWAAESKRWSETLGQLRENQNFCRLSDELYQDSITYSANSKDNPSMEKYGDVLLDLANLVTPLY